jgi:hypothetical protein
VAICGTRDEVAGALPAFSAADAQDPIEGATRAPRYLAQAHLAGRTQYFQGVAWKGRLLAGYAGEKLVGNPEPTGPTTVTRYFRSPRLRTMTEHIVAGFGMTGLFVAEFRTDERTRDSYLIEINRRISPATHLSAARNVDLCAGCMRPSRAPPRRRAWTWAKARKDPVSSREWLRDPESRHLRDYPVDVPWDEPS